jgi:ring-1,2-phenylacetyl-CoA epoxidase subunit PaaC
MMPVFGAAMLEKPDSDFAHQGGKSGKRHTEHLGHMLATMQFLPRAYPDARW